MFPQSSRASRSLAPGCVCGAPGGGAPCCGSPGSGAPGGGSLLLFSPARSAGQHHHTATAEKAAPSKRSASDFRMQQRSAAAHSKRATQSSTGGEAAPGKWATGENGQGNPSMQQRAAKGNSSTQQKGNKQQHAAKGQHHHTASAVTSSSHCHREGLQGPKASGFRKGSDSDWETRGFGPQRLSLSPSAPRWVTTRAA